MPAPTATNVPNHTSQSAHRGRLAKTLGTRTGLPFTAGCRSGNRVARRLEPVADAGFRLDEPWTHRVGFDLSSQVADVDAEVLLRIAVRVAPHRSEQLLMRQRLPRVRDERAEQQPLGRRQMHELTGPLDATTSGCPR